MSSLEFTTRIEGGVIHLPEEFDEYDNAVAHVIVNIETADEKKARKDRLFAAFKKAQKANLFADIKNPVEWQRKLRDEWD